jgi:glutamine synthetase
MRVSVASAGNDHRLGFNEAPPAIVSIFLGDELTEILEAIESGKPYLGREKHQMEIGVTALPHFPKDSTDRNRTSPFAFTGNKFEFRMLGSAFSCAGPNIVLNTIAAEVLRQFADSLENSKDFTGDLAALVKKSFSEHKRIIFNGNNYSEDWAAEAERRGLSNLKTTVDALPEYISQKSIELFAKHNVFTKTEIHSRYEILMDAYCKTLNIEALTMTDMVRAEIIPACVDYQNDLAKLLKRKKACGDYDNSLEDHLLERISNLSASMLKKLSALENAILESTAFGSNETKDILSRANFYRDRIFTAMSELRLVVDELETLAAKKYWTLPTYAQMLNSVV